MRKSQPADPAVVVTNADGTIARANRRAQLWLAAREGLPCWQVVGAVARGAQVRCAPGCASRLVRDGGDAAVVQAVSIGGRPCLVSCTPLEDKTIAVVTPLAQAPGRDEAALTPREVEVLKLMAEGLTLRGIAGQLSIGVATVKTHVEHLRDKLGARTQGGLVAQGFERGYL